MHNLSGDQLLSVVEALTEYSRFGPEELFASRLIRGATPEAIEEVNTLFRNDDPRTRALRMVFDESRDPRRARDIAQEIEALFGADLNEASVMLVLARCAKVPFTFALHDYGSVTLSVEVEGCDVEAKGDMDSVMRHVFPDQMFPER